MLDLHPLVSIVSQVLVMNYVPFVLKNPKDLSNRLNFLDAMKKTAKQIIFSTARRYNLKLCISILSKFAPLLWLLSYFKKEI